MPGLTSNQTRNTIEPVKNQAVAEVFVYRFLKICLLLVLFFVKDASISASTSTQNKKIARQASVELGKKFIMPEPIGFHIGELQEKWKFPSDHLPVGITVNGLNIASWNVLNTEYIDWVTEKNSQGLSRSLIAEENVFVAGSGLTVRDKHVVRLVCEMISHPTHPRKIIALQECGKPFIEELRKSIPNYFELIPTGQKVLLVDGRYLGVISVKNVMGIFDREPGRGVQVVKIRRKDNGKILKIINAHLPGDPAIPACSDFSKYLAKIFDPKITTIAMGDMNTNEIRMQHSLHQAFSDDLPFSLYSPYCTNISPYVLRSKAIDHFIVYNKRNTPAIASKPNEVLEGLDYLVYLLHNPAF